MSLPVSVKESETPQSYTLIAVVAQGPAKVVARGQLVRQDAGSECGFAFMVDRLLVVGVGSPEATVATS